MAMHWYAFRYPPRPSGEKMTPQRAKIAYGDSVIGLYASYIYANSRKHAQELALLRNIDEIMWEGFPATRKDPYLFASKLLLKRTLSVKDKLDIIHSVTFLSYLLMQSCFAPPCDIIGDEGLLHQTIHCLCFGSPERRAMAVVVEYFERKVPGYSSRHNMRYSKPLKTSKPRKSASKPPLER